MDPALDGGFGSRQCDVPPSATTSSSTSPSSPRKRLIVLTSVAPVRRWCYAAFLVLHYLLFPALFVTLCYSTIFAPPWILPPWAFHGADFLLQILRWQVVMGRVEGKEGEMSLEAYPLSGCNAPSQQRYLRGGGHVSLLGDAMTEGEWERVRRGEQACAAQGEGKNWPRDPGALDEDSGLRCLEIEKARRKHGSLVDGHEQQCALLDSAVRTPGEAGARSGRRKPAERREGAPMAAISNCKIFMAQR
ncbi:hypothetical protein DFH08DRAFT_944369 [Mycena albidolilacea]|uniref:Uncharacterized protein n=1 Tax=Mycena albidolilacea TaxID=1033008 RepID=A0AAD7EB24_9AGAR|nr:hypothetical protein DFH08DRAFT_944369 [Mycena albidolilacea]